MACVNSRDGSYGGLLTNSKPQMPEVEKVTKGKEASETGNEAGQADRTVG